MKWPRRWRAAPAHWKEPTEKQREQWRRLLERYAASNDPEQNMVVDIVNYFARQVEGRSRASSSAFTLLSLEHRKGEARNQKKTENSRRGGQHSPYAKVHDKAEEAYKGDPDSGKPDAARFAIESAEAAPKKYGLEAGARIPYDTIYRELLRRTKDS